MELNENLRRRLVEGLSAWAEAATVMKRRYLAVSSIRSVEELSAAFPRDLRDQFKGYVNDTPMADFVALVVERMLADQEITEDVDEHLIELLGFQDGAAIATSIVEAIESLPWSYAFAVPLPASLEAAMPPHGVWALSDNVRLATGVGFTGTYRTATEFGIFRTMNRLFGTEPKARSYLVVDVEGLFERYTPTRTHLKAVEHVKSVLGLMMALGLLRYRYSWQKDEAKTEGHINRRHADGTYKAEHAAPFNASTSEALRMLQFEPPAGSNVEASWPNLVGRHLNDVKRVLADAAHRRRLLLAAKWYFDSFTGDSELLRYVQAMVSLEILVGEENKAAYEKIGIGELMRNRVAYLIGRNTDERAEIMENFTKLYDVRSRIVHRGHSDLSQEEKHHLFTLRSYCARVIRAEVRQLPGAVDFDDNWPDAILEPPTAPNPLQPMIDAIAEIAPAELAGEAAAIISEAEVEGETHDP